MLLLSLLLLLLLFSFLGIFYGIVENKRYEKWTFIFTFLKYIIFHENICFWNVMGHCKFLFFILGAEKEYMLVLTVEKKEKRKKMKHKIYCHSFSCFLFLIFWRKGNLSKTFFIFISFYFLKTIKDLKNYIVLSQKPQYFYILVFFLTNNIL